MFTTAIISFREFLEAFLIVGIFVAISKKTGLRKEREIVAASLIGIILSFLVSLTVYLFGEQARRLLTEENADMVEGFLLIFSGVFIAYVVFSLHALIQKKRDEVVTHAKNRIRNEMFDISLFLTIVFLIMREGLEIALFTASASLFSTFIQNAAGLAVGFFLSALMGLLLAVAYENVPIQTVFKATEYLIILVGAAMIQHGLTILSAFYLHLDLSKIGQLGWSFLPGEDTLAGHLLQGFTGLDREISALRLTIMVAYIVIVYLLFLRRNKLPSLSH